MMRRATPTILLLALAAAAALTAPAGAAKECTTKGCAVKSGLYKGPVVLYVGNAPPYSAKGQVALLRGETGTNPTSGTCQSGAGPSPYRANIDGRGEFVMKGKPPKIGVTKTYKGRDTGNTDGEAFDIKVTVKVKFSSAKRAKLSISIDDRFGDGRCTGKGSWSVKR